jgi:hypothetical protein
MSDTEHPDRGLSPEAQAIDEQGKGLVRDLVDLDALRAAGDPGPPGAGQASGSATQSTRPLHGGPTPAEDAAAYLRLEALATAPDEGSSTGPLPGSTGASEQVESAIVAGGRKATWTIVFLAFATLIVAVVALLALRGNDQPGGGAAPAPTQLGASSGVAPAAAGAQALESCSAAKAVTVRAVQDSAASGTAGTTYQGTVTVVNTSDGAITVPIHQTWSAKDASGVGDAGSGWNGAWTLAPGESRSEYVVAQHFDQTGVTTWSLIDQVAPYRESTACTLAVAQGGDTALDQLAVAVANPFPVP